MTDEPRDDLTDLDHALFEDPEPPLPHGEAPEPPEPPDGDLDDELFGSVDVADEQLGSAAGEDDLFGSAADDGDTDQGKAVGYLDEPGPSRGRRLLIGLAVFVGTALLVSATVAFANGSGSSQPNVRLVNGSDSTSTSSVLHTPDSLAVVSRPPDSTDATTTSAPTTSAPPGTTRRAATTAPPATDAPAPPPNPAPSPPAPAPPPPPPPPPPPTDPTTTTSTTTTTTSTSEPPTQATGG